MNLSAINEAAAPRLLLVSANPLYANTMAFLACRRKLSLECWDGISEPLERVLAADFDVIIIDLTMLTVDASRFAAMLSDTPIVVTCNYTPTFSTAARWPQNICSYVAKERGSDAILDVALALHRKAHPLPIRLKAPQSSQSGRIRLVDANYLASTNDPPNLELEDQTASAPSFATAS